MPLLHVHASIRTCTHTTMRDLFLQASYLHAEAESWALPLPHSPGAGAVPIAADVSVRHAQHIRVNICRCQLVLAIIACVRYNIFTARAHMNIAAGVRNRA